MEIRGLCKVERTKERDEAIVAARDSFISGRAECAERIKKGDFTRDVKKSFMGIKWTSKELSEKDCEEAYPEVFKYAYIFDREDGGPPVIMPSSKYEALRDIALMVIAGGDMYLTPAQCRIYAGIV